MVPKQIPRYISGAVALAVLLFSSATPANADSSSPKLAAYYDWFMAICDGQVYEWEGDASPRKVHGRASRVGVGRSNRYALTKAGALLGWQDDPAQAIHLMDGVKSFHAGQSGLFIIRNDNSLWHQATKRLFGFGEGIEGNPQRISESVFTAAIGDSANYYVTLDGALFVKGRAHRGQYGNGELASTDQFVQTATDVIQVSSHTGHALVLKTDGSVWGTGGNIYGPLGQHGYGDKATRWGMIFKSASAIATGSSHSLAIRRDNSLWTWGRGEGLDPKQILTNVTAVAAGRSASIALSMGALWQWDRGSLPRKIMRCQ